MSAFVFAWPAMPQPPSGDSVVATDTLLGYAGASTRRVGADNAIEYAYRNIRDSAVPLVLLQHFRGNLDNWDPALIDALAADRRVVASHGFLFQHHSRFAADVNAFLMETG